MRRTTQHNIDSNTVTTNIAELMKIFPPVRLKILKATFYKAKSILTNKFQSTKALIYVVL